MRQINWSRLGTEVCDLACDAGARILEIYNESNDAQVSYKADASPLTVADLAAHRCISEGLVVLTPDIPVVSEECAESLRFRLPTGRFWLVDPLDGTKEFVARNGEFTVNIALIEDGCVAWGLVYAPVLGLLYWGGRRYGSFRQLVEGGEAVALRVAEPVGHQCTYRVVASKSHLNSETEAFIKQLGSASLIQAGSSLKLCRVAEGSADVYPRLAPTSEWDTAAAQAVVEGAGGYVMGIEGHVLAYGKADVLNPSFIVASVPLNRLVRRG